MIGLLPAIFFFCAPASGQDWAQRALEASPRRGEWVSIRSEGRRRRLRAFVVYPETKRRAPAIVIVHDAFGFSDWARDVADQFAKRGYVAIVPDLLSGKGVFGGMYAARTAISGLRTKAVMTDLDAAADYVRRLPAANGRVSVVGFSWGGDQAFEFAAHRRGLRAAYVFYGRPPPNPAAVKAPVFGFYGGRDTQIDPKLAETAAVMRAAGRRFEPVTYPEASHGFMRFGEDPVGRLADRDAREMAWNRLQRLFRKWK